MGRVPPPFMHKYRVGEQSRHGLPENVEVSDMPGNWAHLVVCPCHEAVVSSENAVVLDRRRPD